MPHLENPYTTTTEPAHSGAHGPQLERSPQASTKNQWLQHAAMKIPCATTKTWCSFKKKIAKTKTNKPPKSFLKTHQRVQAFWAQATLSPCMLLLSPFSRVRLCATPWTAAYQASPSMGFSRQEHWSGLPFTSPMHESGKWKWSRSVVSDS